MRISDWSSDVCSSDLICVWDGCGQVECAHSCPRLPPRGAVPMVSGDRASCSGWPPGSRSVPITRDERWTTRNDVKDAFSQATGSWLTRELAELRWRALLDRRSGVRWSGSSQQMRLDLNAAREGLRTRAANDYNRTWNMSLDRKSTRLNSSH